MRELVWDQVLSVGNDEIDSDHRILVNLFNLLGHSVSEGESTEYVAAVLEELVNCSAWHFSHEERLMLKYGYEGLGEHRSEHRELIESIRELQGKYLETNSLEEEEFDLIEQWLTGHIFSSDMKFGAYLAGTA